MRSVHIEMSRLISSRERDKMGRSSSVLSNQQALPHTAGFPIRPSHVRLTGLRGIIFIGEWCVSRCGL